MKRGKKRRFVISSELRIALRWSNAIGVVTKETDWTAKGFFDGVYIYNSTLVYNPQIVHVGDLLHELGHFAITPKKLRPLLNFLLRIPSDHDELVNQYCQSENSPDFKAFINAKEDAAIAWSYCAARSMKLDPAILFEQGFPRDTGKIHLQQLNESVGCFTPIHPGVNMLYESGMLAKNYFPYLNHWLQPL